MDHMFEKGNLRELKESIMPEEEKTIEQSGEEGDEIVMDMTLNELEKMNKKLQATHNSIEELATLFQNRLVYDANQEKVIDQMHAELQKYKNDLFATLLRPILVDIIEVVDSIRKTGEAFAGKGDAEKEASGIILGYIEDLHNLLASYNVEVYKSTPGDSYTPIKQRIVSCVMTGEMALNGKLVESLGFGYLHNGKVIWAEKVKVYKYQLM